MAIPKIKKVVVNMGLGEATQNAKIADTGADEIARITGQKPVITRSKKSIAQFKLRKGMPIGAMVTLRGERMWEFLDRLVSVALPRVRDFRGVSPKGFDGRGNFTLGLKDQLLFPEIDYMKVDKARGHEHLGRHDGEDRRRVAQAAAAARDAVQASLAQSRPGRDQSRDVEREDKGKHGHDCKDRQGSEDAEVQGPAAKPLQALRPAPCVPAQVRALPPVLPQAGARGRHRRSDEEQLVDKPSALSCQLSARKAREAGEGTWLRHARLRAES